MKPISVGRPLGCLKAALRATRLQRTAQRSIATAALPQSAFNGAFNRNQREEIKRVSQFQVYPPVPSVRATVPNPMPALRKAQVEKLDPTGARTRMFSKEHADSAKVGDVLMVTTKQGEPFAGAFIQIRRRGVDTAIQLRGQLMKTGVEMWFKIYSPSVTAIDVIWRRPKRARRARLTYMRKPKHDMGSVDQLVFAWKRERYALRSREKARAGHQQRKK
ncbi:unnamed protein product [Clonostachys byssicola]|uniref:Ribosomal protein L19 n=1 Tax=Clonostachys byssicola TaxID=160290 RepID=A0A9N9XV94_9HYPO|nr:unnamed protein product [Clonostachys byssicola]